MESEFQSNGDYFHRHSQITGNQPNLEYGKFDSSHPAGEPSMMVYERAAIFLEQYKPRKSLQNEKESIHNQNNKQENHPEMSPNIDNKNVNEKSSWRFAKCDSFGNEHHKPTDPEKNINGEENLIQNNDSVQISSSQHSFHDSNIQNYENIMANDTNLQHYERQCKTSETGDSIQRELKYSMKDYVINQNESFNPKENKEKTYNPNNYSNLDYSNYSKRDSNYSQKNYKTFSNISPYHLPLVESDHYLRNRVPYSEYHHPSTVEIQRLSSVIDPIRAFNRNEMKQYSNTRPVQATPYDDQMYMRSSTALVPSYSQQFEPATNFVYSTPSEDIWTRLYKVVKQQEISSNQSEYCILAFLSLIFIYCMETILLTSFRLIVHVKKKADQLLAKCWYKWQFSALVRHKKKPPLKLLLYAPTMLLLACFYVVFWLIYIVNRTLVKPVSSDLLKKIEIEKFYGECFD